MRVIYASLLCLLALGALRSTGHSAAGSKGLDAKRRLKVERCASCHAKVYENWKKGPHAHAYEAVDSQFKKAADPKSPLSAEDRVELKQEGLRTECFACHAPIRTVYEDSIPSDWDGRTPFAHNDLSLPPGAEGLSTGVDCITCHIKGNRVVTRSDYKRSEGFVPPNGFCDPLPSKTFSHINNCMTCHANIIGEYRGRYHPASGAAARKERPTFTEYLERYSYPTAAVKGAKAPKREGFPLVSCNDCHMQVDGSGSPTHLYYWDSGPGKIAAMLEPVFDGFSASIQRNGSERRLRLLWPTDFAPHGFVPFSPKLYIFLVEVRDVKGRLSFSKRFLFYHLLEDMSVAKVTKYNPDGEHVRLTAQELFKRDYLLPRKTKDSGTIRLTILKKPKYDYPDSTTNEVYRREQAYRL